MNNLIKSDIYRLKKNKVFRNCISSMIVVILLVTSFFSDPQASIALVSTSSKDRIYGFFLDGRSVRSYGIETIMPSFGLTMIICIMLVFIVGELVRERYEYGVIKNTISYGHNRYKIYISNLICIFIGIITLSIFTIFISYIAWKTIYGQDMPIKVTEIIIIIKMILLQLIILCSMSSIYTMIFTIVRKKSTVVGFAILFFTFISTSLIELNISYINSKVPIMMLMDICSVIPNDKTLLMFSINSIIIILITTFIGCTIFNKQDIK